MQPKLAIFDLDGTLLNTIDDLHVALNVALQACGLPACTVAQTMARVGNGIEHLLRASLPADVDAITFDTALTAFHTHYSAHMTDLTRPYDGILDMLTATQQAGVRMAVLSNKHHPAARALVAQYFGAFDMLTFGDRAGVPRKPDPSSCLELMTLCGGDAQNTVYIGDSGVDMQTAKNAGLYAIGVTWGFRSRAVLVENGADCLVDTAHALADLLTNQG